MPDELCEIKTKVAKSEGSKLQVWHLVLSVVGVIFALIVQSSTAVWWAASITSDVRNEKLARSADKRNQKETDARQDMEIQRNDDRRIAELREINQKLDWIVSGLPRR